MSDTPQGLLFVFGQCEPDVSTKDFNAWYDEEHAPARLTVPGITSAVRYKATDDQKPEWLAIYDLSTPDTLNTPEYLHLREIASENERTLVPLLPILQRRIYSLVAQLIKPSLPENDLPGKYLLVVLWSVKEELDTEFHKWYDEEHTAEIAKVPGWLRGRRYRLTSGVDLQGQGPPIEGWNYLVMHEWDRGDYREDPQFKAALQTPWATKMLGGAKGLSLRQFVLHKNFERQ